MQIGEGGTLHPIVVLFFSDQSPDGRRFHSRSYTNPRLQARVLPALRNGDHSDRADVRCARANIQTYDAHVADLYQWVCALYLASVKGAETKAKRS